MPQVLQGSYGRTYLSTQPVVAAVKIAEEIVLLAVVVAEVELDEAACGVAAPHAAPQATVMASPRAQPIRWVAGYAYFE